MTLEKASYIDLHTHSYFSDGSLSPEELIGEAEKANLRAVALTDHETAAGCPRAESAARKAGIEFIKGIEISTEQDGIEYHIVGLDIDPDNRELADSLADVSEKRKKRNRRMLENLRKDGIDLDEDKIHEKGKGVITRANLGRALVDQGYAQDIPDAFRRFIGTHSPYYVHAERLTPEQAIRLIRASGGIPVLAHPLKYNLTAEDLKRVLIQFRDEGLMAMEAYYSLHSAEDTACLRYLARKLGLKVSGGSDFHGSNKPCIHIGTGLGNLHISYEVLKNLRDR